MSDYICGALWLAPPFLLLFEGLFYKILRYRRSYIGWLESIQWAAIDWRQDVAAWLSDPW